jgi:hypothetical protein
MIRTIILSTFILATTPPIGPITPTSPLVGAGTPVGAPDTDYCGNARPAGHPSIGAFDINSGPNCENLSNPPPPSINPPTIIEKP